MSSASALDNGTEMPARWSLRLLGGFELTVLPGGARVTSLGKRERLLLAYLALSPNCRQPRRKLATLLWGDANDETLLDNLRPASGSCARRLAIASIVSLPPKAKTSCSTVRLSRSMLWRFAASRPNRAGPSWKPRRLYTPANFWMGSIIESEEFESWRRAEATRYRDQAIDVLTRLMTQLAECGETERAIEVGDADFAA